MTSVEVYTKWIGLRQRCDISIGCGTITFHRVSDEVHGGPCKCGHDEDEDELQGTVAGVRKVQNDERCCDEYGADEADMVKGGE